MQTQQQRQRQRQRAEGRGQQGSGSATDRNVVSRPCGRICLAATEEAEVGGGAHRSCRCSCLSRCCGGSGSIAREPSGMPAVGARLRRGSLRGGCVARCVSVGRGCAVAYRRQTARLDRPASMPTARAQHAVRGIALNDVLV